MSGHCKWCDTLTNSIIKQVDNGVLIWVGCPDCFIKKATKRRLRNNDERSTK